MSTHTDDELLTGIRAVAAEHLDFHGELDPDTPLIEAMALDSIRLLTLVMEIENHFAITLEAGDEAEVETVGELMDLIRDRA